MYSGNIDLDDFSYSLESYMIQDYEVGMEGKLGEAFNKVKTGFSGFVKWIGKKISEICGKILDFIKHPVKTVKAGIAAGKEKRAERKENKQENKDRKFLEKASGKKKLSKNDIKKIASLSSANLDAAIEAVINGDGDTQDIEDVLNAITNVNKYIDSPDNSEAASQDDFKQIASIISKLEKIGRKLESANASDDSSNEKQKRHLLNSISSLVTKIFSKKPTDDVPDPNDGTYEGGDTVVN